MMFRWVAGVLLLAMAIGIAGGSSAWAQSKTPPYWASISVDEARMRVGPSLDYPSNWVYQRKNLPVRVVQVHGNWRKVQDESGAEGWMHVRLLSDTATAMVSVPEGRMYQKRSDASGLLFRVEKGVVGRVSDCDGSWCQIDIGGKRGFIRAAELWGAVQ
ncbi:MAG: SH3 domain-containing protein [Sphingobium sp.]